MSSEMCTKYLKMRPFNLDGYKVWGFESEGYID